MTGIIVTSDQAKTKTCCVDRNRSCQGEGCMAWTLDTHAVSGSTAPERLHNSPLPPSVKMFVKTGKGYCGMVRG